MTEIIFNGKKEKLEKQHSVLDLLGKYELSPDIVTVNLNGSILQKGDFASTLLNSGDTVDVLMFMGGGR